MLLKRFVERHLPAAPFFLFRRVQQCNFASLCIESLGLSSAVVPFGVTLKQEN